MKICKCKIQKFKENGDCVFCDGLTPKSKFRNTGTCLWCGCNFSPCCCEDTEIKIANENR